MTKKSGMNLKTIRLIQIALSLGISLVFWAFIGFFLGRWLDERLGTEPLFMALTMLLFIGYGFYGFIKEMITLSDMEKKERLKERDSKASKEDAVKDDKQ